MTFIGQYFQHRNAVQGKQQEREERIKALPEYNEPLTVEEFQVLAKPAYQVIGEIQKGETTPRKVLDAYGKQALNAQRENNCLTEIMIRDAETFADKIDTSLPLAGFPISLKDTCNVEGYDSCIGYAKKCFQPAQQDGNLVRLLRDAGGVPFVKTNVPLTLMAFESYNDVWGYTENPHVKGFSAGGSTGGESSLLAYGGSSLGIGTDVAGSVRVPSHFSGSYAIKCSVGRFPRTGNTTSMPGQEGIPAVYSPMTRTLDDLGFFLKVIVDMEPWKYDYTCHPLPWRSEKQLPEKCRVGVIRDDGVITPTPACARALDLCVKALQAKGHEIVEFNPPAPIRALRIAQQLSGSDGGAVYTRDQLTGENNDGSVAASLKLQHLPRWVKKVYAWYLYYIKGDTVLSYLVRDYNVKTIVERWNLAAEREVYKNDFFNAWQDAKIDFLLTVPHCTPAFPKYNNVIQFWLANYTFLYNLLDYSAGVLPVTKVDKTKDALPKDFKIKSLNYVAQIAYKYYDAAKMDGLPVGVQVVGQRLEEEKVLEAMKLVETSLADNGTVYSLLNA
ncbi:amidase signature enzyme [Nadsonia fulvescens var. elongata DSM 6958]|uniref:amidase n=1 Tax=Nadsonia fulvescens var. elongata DSM 6958 TaxID=857566 RepID=A0A1E3PJH9_9ASCO|nr:amidase signature enzyme [Nadsonia fulvescens var. elongata DSM 6958]